MFAHLNAAAIAAARRADDRALDRAHDHADGGPDRRAAAAAADGGAVAIEVVEETGSTNADLLARIGTLPGPVLRVAQRQTAGRGRAGRRWESDAGSLTFSLAWRFTRALPELLGLPLAVGVMLAETLRARNAAVGLKWPNDLLSNGRKLGGILVETATVRSAPGVDAHRDGAGVIWAVIGVGINLAPATAAPPDAIAPTPAAAGTVANLPAAGLSIAMLPATDRNRLLAALLDAMVPGLQAFDADGFAPWAGRWNALHAFAGQQVRLLDGQQERHAGRALGVDDSGRLLLDTAAGTIAVMAGDVSLRPLAELR